MVVIRANVAVFFTKKKKIDQNRHFFSFSRRSMALLSVLHLF